MFVVHIKKIFFHARRLGIAKRMMRDDFFPEPQQLPAEMEDNIMNSICAMYDISEAEPDESAVSLRAWILSGIFVILSFPGASWAMKMIPSAVLRNELLFPVSVTLGLLICVYCTLLIGTHLADIAKLFDKKC